MNGTCANSASSCPEHLRVRASVWVRLVHIVRNIPKIESGPKFRLSRLKMFAIFLITSRRMLVLFLKLDHNRLDCGIL